jgi:hypothetical protein
MVSEDGGWKQRGTHLGCLWPLRWPWCRREVWGEDGRDGGGGGGKEGTAVTTVSAFGRGRAAEPEGGTYLLKLPS